MSFYYYKDIFAKYPVSTIPRSGDNNNENMIDKFRNTVLSDQANATTNEINSEFMVSRTCYDGNTIWWVGQKMAKSWITSNEANKIFADNKIGVFEKLIGTEHDKERFVAEQFPMTF